MVAVVEEALVLWMAEHGYMFEGISGRISAESLASNRPLKGPHGQIPDPSEKFV